MSIHILLLICIWHKCEKNAENILNNIFPRVILLNLHLLRNDKIFYVEIDNASSNQSTVHLHTAYAHIWKLVMLEVYEKDTEWEEILYSLSKFFAVLKRIR